MVEDVEDVEENGGLEGLGLGLSLQPLACLKSEVYDEKHAVNRLTICIVFVVSMSQKQLIETMFPTIDLHFLFPK